MLLVHYLPNVDKLTVIQDRHDELPMMIGGLTVSQKDALKDGKTRLVFRNVPKLNLSSPMDAPIPGLIDVLSCASCGLQVNKTGHRLRSKELPGRDWTELVDCWSCHRSEFAVVTTRLQVSHENELILPKEGYLFHRGMNLILNGVDIVNVTEDGKCSKCHVILGDFLDKDHLRLFHGLVLFEALEDGSSHAPGHGRTILKGLMVKELLDHIEAQGITHFGINNKLFIRAISWGSRLLVDTQWHSAMIVAMTEKYDDTISISWPEPLFELFHDLLNDSVSMEYCRLLDYDPDRHRLLIHQ